eukprot:TRINITY_DN7389_c0_g1_i2.p1 TRINITY_DN7389_c0_g1~~TRINITY_DN7389_c0_g1_i2.p1  ORF type:complete len:124 (-),score=33.10 TRINITY_DN7389_c0_g1_i2:7-378(-)
MMMKWWVKLLIFLDTMMCLYKSCMMMRRLTTKLWKVLVMFEFAAELAPGQMSVQSTSIHRAVIGDTMFYGHQANTSGGKSGAPVIRRSTGCVVGIHIAGYWQHNVNKLEIISDDLMVAIEGSV